MGELEPAAAALRYAAHGWALVPFHWIEGPGRCSCGCVLPVCSRRGKHPLVPLAEASRGPAIVGGWWERWPAANILVAAAPSGLLVLDVDAKPSAQDALRA